MDSRVTILLVLAALAVPLIVLFFIRLRRNQDEIQALIEAKFGGKNMIVRDPMAYLVAQQSRGYSQNQGNGNLILTEDELFFAMTMPKTVISIPRKNVGEVKRVSRMCAQQRLGQVILKIQYTDDLGREDALGLKLKDMDRWETEIGKMRSRASGKVGGVRLR